MGSIGDAISEPIPAVGTAGTTYASQLVAFLTEVKTRLIARVPMSSLLVGLLDMANNAIQNLQYVGLYESATQPTTPIGSLQRFQDDLWYVSDAGAFALTNGAQLNATAINGITGDYGSPNPAEFKFVDADKEYYAYDDFAGGVWAKIYAHNFDIAASSTSSTRVRLAFGGGSSFTLTLPPALPATTRSLHVTSAGQIQVGANDRVLNISPYSGVDPNSVGAYTFAGTPASVVSTATPTTLYFPLDLLEGDRIKSITYTRKGNVATTGDFEVSLITTTSGATPTDTIVFNGVNQDLNIANAWGDKTHDVTDTTLAAGVTALVQVVFVGIGLSLGNIRVTYDRPNS